MNNKRFFYKALTLSTTMVIPFLGMPASAQADANWVSASGDMIPSDALVGGQEPPPGQQTLYVCTVQFNGGTHPGKVRQGIQGCNIGWGGSEYTVINYQVLLKSPNFIWVPASDGNIPQGAVKGGAEHPPGQETLYVCRADFNDGTYPGKVRPAFGGCNISWGGEEHAVINYEVLVDPIQWINANGGEVPADALKGGQEHPPAQQSLYVCRAQFNGGTHPGKVRPALGGCSIGWGGQEHMVGNYQVLLNNPYLKWVPAAGGAIPNGAIQSGQEHPPGQQNLYVCRAYFNGGTHPGKVRPGFHGCNLGGGGKENTVIHYEVLAK